MKVVVDVSALLAVALCEAERREIVALTRGWSLQAPTMLPYELGQALSKLARRRVISSENVESVRAQLAQIPIALRDVDVGEALVIAARQNISAFDAYQIRCAKDLGCSLLTLDRRLGRAARAEGIVLRREIAP
jgi:predicted nucleic acid-binding protein